MHGRFVEIELDQKGSQARLQVKRLHYVSPARMLVVNKIVNILEKAVVGQKRDSRELERKVLVHKGIVSLQHRPRMRLNPLQRFFVPQERSQLG